ncbi:polyhydroxybutyrate depolymerase [Pelobates cultripes]|uniref:Polyhydroxybutyrate depolymerase n=1 Tax=Pelobates cultripes TaxID=61616 RepID=A0AAD1W020_PELCU|nr:polyhydroxybutyrate depolymerase [Pelobates cultripes]
MKGYLLLLALFSICNAQSRLGSYNIDSTISVSGISSGAYMANQFHVAQSKKVIGAALFAGGPYYCASGSMLTATNACMKLPSSINVNSLKSQTQSYANSGLIDPVSNLANSKVFIFSGSRDTVVVPGVVKKLEEYYLSYVNSGNIRAVYDIPVEHGMPTDSYGGTCGSTNSEYINNCGYNGAYEALNQIYGGLRKPSSSAGLTGQLILYDQSEYFKLASAGTYGMDTAGYVYIPSSCQSGTRCRLHIAFHGCLQGREKLGDRYARNAGYNQVADLNNLIILYPQAKSNFSNPNGCWDWWGFSSYAYANKNGYQMTGVERMMLRTMGQY